MKKRQNLAGIAFLLLLLMACQPTTTTIELRTATFAAPSNIPTSPRIAATPTVGKEEGNELPIVLSTATFVAPVDIPTLPGIVVTAQPTVREESNEFDGVQSALLFQIGNEEGGILNVDSGEVHYFDDQWRLYSWSPSGKQLLFSVGEVLYTADADGSNRQLAYDENEINKLSWPAGFATTDFHGFWLAQWLTDDIVLLSLTTIDYAPLNPFLYSLDVNQGSLKSIDLDNWHVILNISPDSMFWLQASENGIQLATIDGKNIPVWPDYFNTPYVTLPGGPSLFPILPNGESFVFDACLEPGEACHIFRATIVNLETLLIEPIFPAEPEVLEDLQISPDGQYLAFVQPYSRFLYIINLRTNALAFKLPWDEIYSPADLLWSPDSQTLAYASATSNGYEVMFGIKGIDIKTGEISVIMHTRTAVNLLDWRYISQQMPPYR